VERPSVKVIDGDLDYETSAGVRAVDLITVADDLERTSRSLPEARALRAHRASHLDHADHGS
jgi:hypothetical protein